MKNYLRIALVLSFFFVFHMVGCSYIRITSPPEDRKLIVTPYDLKVAHTGCGSAEPETLKATLIYEPTDGEQDISNAFTYSGGEWTSANYPLHLFWYTFRATADVDTGPFCIEYKKSDERKFYVLAPTCLKGKVFWQMRLADGSIREGPWSGATVQFFVSRNVTEFPGQFVGETRSDPSGNFCVDRIPLAIPLDIVVPLQDAPGEVGPGGCDGRMEGIIAFNSWETCPGGNCKEAGTVRASCRQL
jgi:hypothetical protein